MALSVDLRERVLAAHERREGSQRLLAERFGVALGTVNAWLRQAREGRRAPRRRGRYAPAVLCRALRRAGLRRKKKPCTPASRNGPTLLPHGRPGGRRSWIRSIPAGPSSSTRAAPTPPR